MFNGIKRRILQKGTTRSFLTLVSGTTLAQVFSLIFFPVFGRIFSPEDFGLFSALNTISAIMVVILSGKYEQAIIIAHTRKEAVNIVSLALSSAASGAVVLILLMLFFSDLFLIAIHQEFLRGWIYLAPVIAFLIIVYNTFNEWCVKEGRFSALAINKITNSASLSLSKFLLGSLKVNTGLVYGELAGRFISALSCICHWVRIERKVFKQISWSQMKEVAKKYSDFPKYIMPDQIINTLAGSLTIFFIVQYFGEKSLGLYSMTQYVLAAPAVIVGQAVTDVFRNKANLIFEKEGNCKDAYNQLAGKIVPIVIVGVIVIFPFLPALFDFVLGDKWLESGKYAQILLPAIAMGFLNNSFGAVWIIAGKLKQRFCWQIFYFLMIFISMIVGCWILNNIYMAIICLSIGLFISYSLSFYFTWKFSRGD